MRCWQRAGAAERKQFDAIAELFADNPGLLGFVFHPEEPKLSAPPADLLKAARGLSSGDYLRVRVALDLWSGSGSVFVHELLEVDPAIYDLVLKAMMKLAV